MPAWSQVAFRRIARCLVLLTCFSAFACSSSDEVTPEPRRSPPLGTIEASELGDQLTVTASVADLPVGHSFVVRDVDLPDDGLLVLGEADVRVPALVTVVGTIERFSFDRFRDRYQLAERPAYVRFEGRKILVAEKIHSWASTEPSP